MEGLQVFTNSAAVIGFEEELNAFIINKVNVERKPIHTNQ
ncbi:MAG: hypothetical protein ACI8PB_004325 [Desulforhopalus sp.]|jgi:hypothetical protein